MTYATGYFSFESLLRLNSKKWLLRRHLCEGLDKQLSGDDSQLLHGQQITNIHSVNVGKGVDTCNNSALGGTNATTVTKECRSFDVRSFGSIY